MSAGQIDSVNRGKRRPSALVVGSVGLDIVARQHAPNRPPACGCAAAGNSGSNIAIRLSSLGWDVCFVTLVGDDTAGELVREDLDRWGVDVTGVVSRPGYDTPIVFQLIGEDGDAQLLPSCPLCGRGRSPLMVPDLDELQDDMQCAIDACSAIVFDIPSSTALGCARAVRENGGLAYYEASLSEAHQADIAAAGALANIVKCSADERSHYEQLLRDDSPVPIQLVTLGAAGVHYRYLSEDGPDREGIVPAVPLDRVVDTIGAGDAFTARLVDDLCGVGISALHRVDTLERTLVRAQSDAARACVHVGARGDLQSSSFPEWIRTDIPFCCARCQGAML